jgi:hypothetical protein
MRRQKRSLNSGREYYDRILHKALASAAMTREEIEKRMDELAREFAKTHDRQIAEKFFELARRLREMEH